MMCSLSSAPQLEKLFIAAFPQARRAAEVRSASVMALLCGAAVDREDIKQEVLIGVWTALPRFDPARASLHTFVERVVVSNIASLFRRCRAKKRTNRPDEHLHGESPRLLVAVEFRVDLQRVLGKLASRDQDVARLLVAHGAAEVARRLRISRPAVYRSVNRIRTALVEAGFGQ